MLQSLITLRDIDAFPFLGSEQVDVKFHTRGRKKIYKRKPEKGFAVIANALFEIEIFSPLNFKYALLTSNLNCISSKVTPRHLKCRVPVLLYSLYSFVKPK